MHNAYIDDAPSRPRFAIESRVAGLILCLLSPWAWADPLDWTYCRGPYMDGTSSETGLADSLDPKNESEGRVVWQRDDLGGRSTPIVMRGRLYTLLRSQPGTAQEGERIVCVDAATGEQLWEHRFNVYLSDVPDTRVGWSSVVGDPETGRVYALGACGTFQCLEGETGEVVWQLPLHERFGLLSTYGGRTNFPVICEDLVIVSALVIGWGETAKPAHRFWGFDKATGEVVWFRGTRPLPYDTTYSAPTVTTLAGRKAIVFGSGDGAVWAWQPRTGAPLWHFDFSRRGLNTSPLVVGDRVFMGQSEENIVGTAMGAVVAISGSGAGDVTDEGELWRVDELMAGKSAPLFVDDRLYVFDDRAKLHVLDAETGESVARQVRLGTVMRANPLYADGKIYAVTANGRWYVLKPNPQQGVEKLATGRFPAGDECHAAPICADGRIYVQTTGRLTCIDAPAKQAGTVSRAAQPQEDRLVDREVDQLLVVPADQLLKPGAQQQYKVRLFNAAGQRLDDQPAEFEVVGAGAMTSDGVCTAADAVTHSAVRIVARVGDAEGNARIRVVPPLPWHFDFEETAVSPGSAAGQPPETWVGARHRHVIRNVDGNQLMVKITTIPKGTRSRCWMGHPELHDYTIQADVLGKEVDRKLPDIGLIAQGYALDLQGANQELQIRSWVPQLRMAETLSFPWKPNIWYRMKLQASNAGEKVVLRGKVWPRDEEEPEVWTIEAEDVMPVRNGSPGLYGNAKDAELWLDNIEVVSNDVEAAAGQTVAPAGATDK